MTNLIIQAYTLLVLASGLLTQLANTPNATPELRKTVESTAEYAISYANNVIKGSEPIAETPITSPAVVEITHSCTITTTATTSPSNGMILNVAWESTESNGTLWVNDGSTDGGQPIYKYSFKLDGSRGTLKGLTRYPVTKLKAVFYNSTCYASL